SRRQHTSFSRDWSSDVWSSDLGPADLDGLWAWARELHRRGGADDDAVVLSEALHTLPPEGWTDSRGRALGRAARARVAELGAVVERLRAMAGLPLDRKSTRLNSS